MRQKMHGINCLIMEREYYAGGNRTAMTYPFGYSISTTYDDLNRLNEIKDPDGRLIADYDYDAMRRIGLTLFNAGTEATFTSYTYDDANDKPDHLISLSNWQAGTNICISSFDYTHDNEGNRLSMEVGPAWESQTGGHEYEYDDIYQLTEVDSPELARSMYSARKITKKIYSFLLTDITHYTKVHS